MDKKLIKFHPKSKFSLAQSVVSHVDIYPLKWHYKCPLLFFDRTIKTHKFNHNHEKSIMQFKYCIKTPEWYSSQKCQVKKDRATNC